MWTGVESFANIQSTGRWKVELFSSADYTVPTSTDFEMKPLRTLLTERKESLDPQAYSDFTFSYLGLENVQPLTGDLVDFQPRLGQEIKSRAKVFRKGDLLYGRLRPYLNKVYLAVGKVHTGICSTEFLVFTPDYDKVGAHYIQAIVSSDYVQRHVKGMQTGSALPRIQTDDLLDILVPVPPLEIQEQYEQFLAAENDRRRRLLKELDHLPERIIEGFLGALEAGTVPSLAERVDEDEEGLACDRYPSAIPSDDFTVRTRSRK